MGPRPGRPLPLAGTVGKQIELCFDTVDRTNNDFEGVYVDDIKIRNQVYLSGDGFESGDTTSWSSAIP